MAMISAGNKEILSQKQQELGDRFLRRSLLDVQHILDYLQLQTALSNPQAMTDLVSLAHRLAGTAATLGFYDLSDTARELETQLASVANAPTGNATALQEIATRVLDDITQLARDRAIA